MPKLYRTILIISLTVIGTGFLAVPSTFAQAQPPSLVVQFEQTPLFNEANFLPGEAVSRWVKVTNNSGATQKIAIETINEYDPDNFASKMNLVIKESAAILYQDTLKKFFNVGETYLSNLANGVQTQYDLTITFDSGSDNLYQGKAVGFDILVGFQGEGAGTVCGNNIKEIDEQCDGTDLAGQSCLTRGFSGGNLSCNTNCTFNTSACTDGGGGGGGLPPGLTILDESVRVTTTTQDSVTITWTTTYFSTSQVVYGTAAEAHTLNLVDNMGTPPTYGYAHSTPEYDTSPKVTGHSVTIYGLTSGTTYYFRAVSHASLAISREYSFTTLGVKEIGEIGGEIPTEEIPPSGGELPSGEVVPVPGEGIEKPEEFITEGAVSPEEGIVTVPPEERAPGGGLASLLLASLGEIGETPWMAILVTICLLGLVAIGIRDWELARKKKKSKF